MKIRDGGCSVAIFFADNEQLGRSGVNCLENLIVSNGEKFTFETWQLSCSMIEKVFKRISPSGLLTWRPDSDSESLLSSVTLGSNELLNHQYIGC